MYQVILNNDICINEMDTNTANRITGQVQKQINSIDSFTFTIYPNNVGYNALTAFCTTVIVVDTTTNKTVFDGRVLHVSNVMGDDGTICKSVTCEGAMGYLCDTLLINLNATMTIRNFLSACLTAHNGSCDADKTIQLGQVIDSTGTTFKFATQYENTLNEINRQLIANEKIGGEIRIRYENGNRYLDYTNKTFTAGSDTRIELAVNMKSSSQEINPDDVVTRLYPLGAKISDDSDARLTLSGSPKYLDNDTLIAQYGIHAGTMIFDDITNATALRIAGQAQVGKLKTARVQYSISAVDLSSINKNYGDFEIGTICRIVNPLINLDDDLRLIAMTVDINDPTQTQLTFGDKFETLTTITAKKNQQLQQQINNITGSQNSLIKSIVDNQTAILCGDNGGHIYYMRDTSGEPTDIFFIDTTNLTTAKKCLRINMGGIGFWNSSDGGSALNGPYTSAWTLDGTFNTAYIVAQTLTGLKINNGNGTFSVDENGNVIAKALQVLGGRVDITADKQTDSRIKLSYRDWTIQMSPLELTLTNSTINGNIKLQAGAASFCNGNTIMAQINCETGAIFCSGINVSNGGKISMKTTAGKQTILLDPAGNTGSQIWADAFVNNQHKKLGG